jgi:hypothetical protein
VTRLRIGPLLERRLFLVTFDEACVTAYMKAAVVPPVVVFESREGLLLADGYHRVEAAQRRGETTIEAEIRPGGYREAVRYAGRMDRSPPNENWLRERAAHRDELTRFRASIGLPVDHDVIDRLLEDWKLGLHVYETDEELARIAPATEAVEAAKPRLRAYAKAHAESYAGMWQDHDQGAPVMCIAFTGDLREHEAALSRERVRVVPATRTVVELDAIAERIGFDELEPVGAEISFYGVDTTANVVEIGADGPDEAAARALVSSLYGDAVRLEWGVGPAIAG